ncbi:Xaa-Pro peptidase family protein [Dellaglioa algida]|uniref:Xaa-Pro aminopeptidase n=1 Tax=Dellaglioa algida DSM 15638 TaxID=1423719 RepID=A0A0R1HPS7_9LACO|nr:Xaa-Pro peptidase family protein [Dellaglioa algida]KRK45130.1 Xaa-Pro aminopeptidase [Dellaglioa algida DSM 15638]MDK1733451.1 Xaa-Pro peptidase family protein [Dellaglioa algida]MDK1734972.1 Xaa-Pro peptidase family protein [Dellaglioa algida]
MSHIASLQQWLANNGTDIAYINDPMSIQYFTGFESDPIERVMALFVFADQDPFLFTPALEVEAAKDTGWKYPVYGYLDHEDAFAIIQSEINKRQNSPKKWAIEKGSLTVERYDAIRRIFPSAEFVADATGFIETLKVIKTPDEIEKLKVAGKWADIAFEVGFKALQEGKTEQDIVAEIEYAMKKQGIMHMSFDTIVQSGKNAAEPHGFPKKDLIQPNALTLFDLGVISDGYISDASRTVAFGKPNEKSLEIHKVCLEAQLTAQAAAKPGMIAEDLDKIARDIIVNAGYGQYFIHRLGHGMGQSEHEFPSIMEGNKMELKPGMCFSIEPGIYIPGVAGVRIEDCIYLTENGNEPFTVTPKTLKTIELH